MKPDELNNKKAPEGADLAQFKDKKENTVPGELKWSKEEEEARAASASEEEKVTTTDQEDSVEKNDQPDQKKEPEKVGKEEKEKPHASEEQLDTASQFGQADEQLKEQEVKQFESVPTHQEASASIEDTMVPMKIKDYTQAEPVEEMTKDSEQAGEKQSKKSQSKLHSFVRIFWVPAMLIVVFIIGLMVGHGVLGDEPVMDVFDLGMWEHLYKLVFSK